MLKPTEFDTDLGCLSKSPQRDARRQRAHGGQGGRTTGEFVGKGLAKLIPSRLQRFTITFREAGRDA